MIGFLDIWVVAFLAVFLDFFLDGFDLVKIRSKINKIEKSIGIDEEQRYMR